MANGIEGVTVASRLLRLVKVSVVAFAAMVTDQTNAGVDTADLSVVVDDGVAVVEPTGPVAWTITVRNSGPSDAIAQVFDSFPDQVSAISWQCTPSGTAICSSDGVGDISDVVFIPAGDSLVYVASGIVNAPLHSTISNTALVGTLNGIIDPDSTNNVSTDTDAVEYLEPPVVSKLDSVASPLDSCGLPDGIETRTNPTQLTLRFSQQMLNPAGNTEAIDVTNPDNYRVIEAGPDHAFTTSDCATPPIGDDVIVPVLSLDYDDATNLVALHVDADMRALPPGTYRVLACGDGLANASGILLDGAANGTAGSDFRSDFRILGTNLIVNPNFDHPFADSWVLEFGIITDDPIDANNSPFSGSVAEPGISDNITVHSITQCVSESGGFYSSSVRSLNTGFPFYVGLYNENTCTTLYAPQTFLATGFPIAMPGAWDWSGAGPMRMPDPPPGGLWFLIEGRLGDVPVGTTARMDSWALRREDDDVIFRTGMDFPGSCGPL